MVNLTQTVIAMASQSVFLAVSRGVLPKMKTEPSNMSAQCCAPPDGRSIIDGYSLHLARLSMAQCWQEIRPESTGSRERTAAVCPNLTISDSDLTEADNSSIWAKARLRREKK
ncbi:hypothetical protein RRG08_054879 [Elysia crispata]|uniref:Uncharacterized protein n=1 Tax=Elysia crispata TaxID=231223 RepID=A0AAE1A5Q0_9GAST|nr:hypothetical protein RRG08_054879 [Elysia crispata]